MESGLFISSRLPYDCGENLDDLLVGLAPIDSPAQIRYGWIMVKFLSVDLRETSLVVMLVFRHFVEDTRGNS